MYVRLIRQSAIGSCFVGVSLCLGIAAAQQASTIAQPATVSAPLAIRPAPSTASGPADGAYVLGPGDQLQIWALGMDESSNKTITIDPDGHIDLPLIGRVEASGRTIDQLRQTLLDKLRAFIIDPQVTVAITEYGSEPVSVLGAVKDPGLRQLKGRKRLVEVLALSGGLTAEAGNTIYLTRRVQSGSIPLPGVTTDGETSTAVIPVSDLLQSNTSKFDIAVRPNDTIAVPLAHMVYVVGAVNRPGGFPIREESISALQALSLAGGIDLKGSAKDARILRNSSNGAPRQEIALNLSKVLQGKSEDVHLQPNDILFVPGNLSKNVTLRALEAGIQIGTGLLIWR